MLALLVGSSVVTDSIRRLTALQSRIPVVAAAPPAPRGVFGEQPRWTDTAGPQYVPANTASVRDHVSRVLRADFEYEPQLDAVATGLSSRLMSAIHHVAHHGPDIVGWRAEQKREWDAVLTALWPVSRELFFAAAPPHLRCAHRAPIHYAAVYACTVALGRSDCELAVDLVLGALAVGDIGSSGNWAAQLQPARGPWTCAGRAEFNDFLRASVEGREFSEMDELCWRKTCDEVDGGYCDGPFSFEFMEAVFGHGNWCAM